MLCRYVPSSERENNGRTTGIKKYKIPKIGFKNAVRMEHMT